MSKIQNVDYNTLDRAKAAFIEASRKTLKFAERFGFVPGESLGASANIFCLDLKPFLKTSDKLYITLLPEGLGTADDARPEELTKADALEFWRNIGIKTISALTNDAAASGLQTVLIGLYLPSSSPEIVFNSEFMEGFLGGIISGCREVGCVYFSGETPQLRNKIYPDKLDIAGALFGLLPPGKLPLDSSKLQPGCRMVFVESSGPHENGFTVLRELAGKLKDGYRTKLADGREFWQAINAPSKLYTRFVQDILTSGIQPAAIENITGHGWQKIMRSSKPLRYLVENTLPVPEVFSFIEDAANYSKHDMLKIFNYGVGQVVFVDSPAAAEKVVEIAAKTGLKAVHAGFTESSSAREVVVKPWEVTLSAADFNLQKD